MKLFTKEFFYARLLGMFVKVISPQQINHIVYDNENILSQQALVYTNCHDIRLKI